MSIFTISTSQEVTKETKAQRGLCIYDGEGNPRWIWPAASRTPELLALYQPVTLRQQAFAVVVRLIFLLRLQRFVFTPIELGPAFRQEGTDWAVFTGTPGPNRKQVISSREGWVMKTTAADAAVPNLLNEAHFLRQLANPKSPRSFRVPELIEQTERGFTMEKLNGRSTWNRFTDRHATALQELRLIEPTTAPIGEWEAWANISARINHLKNHPHAAIPPGLVSNLLQLVVEEDREAQIAYTLAHGDFTPWNTLRLADDRLGIIDWELARTGMPAGFDFFHFHLQQGIMVERKSWREIYAGIRTQLTPAVSEKLFGAMAVSVDRYLRLYLIYHVSYYLSLYQRQADWHQQIYWQLDVWADALAALLPRQDQRKMLISRLFDVLGTKDYAVLKMDNEDPQALPADSDLDVLIGKQEAGEIIEKLASFPHLVQCSVVKKSFMVSVFLLLEDGQILNTDLIWKLKRKSIVYMEVSEMIQNASRSSYGIPVVSPADTRQYLRFFYGLNGATIPGKFGFGQDQSSLPPLTLENKGLRGAGNYLAYLLDTARTMVFNRGFVVTFSGVDGAGKSTVIERVATMLDKQFRRPVKVLRHRPSVLPILSAWRYGKEEAERKSVASLPRTGNNTSRLSSLARFAYYYTDYLLGQWYVYLRYVLRGYVVVYDRYYYDFMVDGRRSNLELPEWVTTMGFWFLRKPAFNFFLFADPETILARKQELAKDTITLLTRRYRGLFKRLGRGRTAAVFTNIENIVLEDTLRLIRRTLLQKTS